MTAVRKGFGCDNMGSAAVSLINALGSTWFHTDTPTSGDPEDMYWQEPAAGINSGIDYVPYLFDNVPSAEQIDNAKWQEPNQTPPDKYNYRLSNWWMVGPNEWCGTSQYWPNGSTLAQQAADLAVSQMDLILSVDPNAKFAMAAGCQKHAPNNPWGWPSWIDSVLHLMDSADRAKIKAISFNWYQQNEAGVTEDDWLKTSIIKTNYDRWNTWKATNTGQGTGGLFFFPNGVQLWHKEIGLEWGGPINTSNDTLWDYPWRIFDACRAKGVDRVSWYGYSPNGNYVNLVNVSGSGSLTTFGQAWANTTPPA